MALEEHCTRAAASPFADACQDEVGEGPVPGKCCAGKMQALRPTSNNRKVRPLSRPRCRIPAPPLTAPFLQFVIQLKYADQMVRC